MKQLLLIITVLLLTLPAEANETLPDSLLTTRKVFDLQFQNRSLAERIISEMRARKLDTPYALDRAEAIVKFNAMDFREAKTVYQRMLKSHEVKDDDQKALYVLQSLSECCELLGQKAEQCEYLQQLITRARACGNNYFLAQGLFSLGKRLHYDGEHEQGIEYVKKANALMAKSTEPDHNHLLYNQMKVLATLYMNEKRFDQALQTMDETRPLFDIAEGWGNQASLKLQDQREFLAKKARLLMQMKRVAAADSAYEAWKAVPFEGRDPKAYFIAPYLRLRGRFAEAISIYRERIEWARTKGDTLSDMALSDKWNLAELYYDKGDYRRSAETYVEVLEITDSLKARTAAANMQHLEAVYQNQEKTAQIMTQKIWLIILGGVIIFLLVTAILLLHYNRIIRQKNRTIQATIDELQRQSDTLDKLSHTDTSAAATETNSLEEDERLMQFLKLDRQIDENQLYLRDDLSREVLCRLSKLDKNCLGKLIQQFSGSNNLSAYLNHKRVAHATRLLKEHPDYTMDAIAEECGLKNRINLYRAFKKEYDMSPADFLKQNCQS